MLPTVLSPATISVNLLVLVVSRNNDASEFGLSGADKANRQLPLECQAVSSSIRFGPASRSSTATAFLLKL